MSSRILLCLVCFFALGCSSKGPEAPNEGETHTRRAASIDPEIWLQWYENRDAPTAFGNSTIRAAGLDHVVLYDNGDDDWSDFVTTLNNADGVGIGVWPRIPHFMLIPERADTPCQSAACEHCWSPSFTPCWDEIKNFLLDTDATGAVAGWYVFDEPDLNADMRQNATPERLEDFIAAMEDAAVEEPQLIKPLMIYLSPALDPHASYSSQGQLLGPYPQEDLDAFVNLVDVIGIDAFPIRPALGPMAPNLASPLESLQRVVDRRAAQNRIDDVKILFAPQAFTGGGLFRYSTLDEARFQAWSALVWGATGLTWVSYDAVRTEPQLSDVYIPVMEEVHCFEDILAGSAGLVSVTNGVRDPSTDLPELTISRIAVVGQGSTVYELGPATPVVLQSGGSTYYELDPPVVLPWGTTSMIVEGSKDATTVGYNITVHYSNNDIETANEAFAVLTLPASSGWTTNWVGPDPDDGSFSTEQVGLSTTGVGDREVVQITIQAMTFPTGQTSDVFRLSTPALDARTNTPLAGGDNWGIRGILRADPQESGIWYLFIVNASAFKVEGATLSLSVPGSAVDFTGGSYVDLEPPFDCTGGFPLGDEATVVDSTVEVTMDPYEVAIIRLTTG